MRYHLPATHPAADAPSATIAGVAFAHGEAEISDLQVGSVGRALESYGAVRGERPVVEAEMAAPVAASVFAPPMDGQCDDCGVQVASLPHEQCERCGGGMVWARADEPRHAPPAPRPSLFARLLARLRG